MADHGAFRFAVSGGHTPWAMFAVLAEREMPWEQVVIFQVDERIEEYIVTLVIATRETNADAHPYCRFIEYGASPRATLHLRFHVTPGRHFG